MKRGSALILALWTIVVLSIMVMAFMYEAKQQSGLNSYVQQRNRANHIIDAGKIIAEVVLTSYKDVADWTEDQDDEEMFEKDRWFREKQDLKKMSKCTIGPILLDEDGEDSSVVTITIETTNSGSKGVINVNELYVNNDGSGDKNAVERWWMIFRSHGIPEEIVPQEGGGKINLWNQLIASWSDWRDENSSVTNIDDPEDGAEDEWYEELEKKYDRRSRSDDRRNIETVTDELKRRPRNGPIPDVRELAYVRGFRDYPAILTGGVINPWEEDEERQIVVTNIMDLFCTVGPSKININNCNSVDALVTIPGIFKKEDIDRETVDVYGEAKEIAEAIIGALSVMPEDQDVDESLTSWPFKDWDDMLRRVEDNPNSHVRSSDIGMEAKQYLAFAAEEDSVFKVRIEALTGGMVRVVESECYVKDKKVRYIKWVEAPSSKE